MIALRDRVTATVEKAISEDQVRIAILLKNSRRLEKFVEHAIGSAKNPMSNAQLEGKFNGLTDGILPTARVSRLIELCWNLEHAADAAELARQGSLA